MRNCETWETSSSKNKEERIENVRDDGPMLFQILGIMSTWESYLGITVNDRRSNGRWAVPMRRSTGRWAMMMG
jgi:hypothetical protein